MDYEFRKNIYAQPIAKFSMEHEVIGRWLSEEISDNSSKIEQILILIQQFEQGSLGFKELIGAEFQVNFSHTGVEIKALHFDADFMDDINNTFSENYDEPLEDENFLENKELLDNTELYNKESYAECGLLELKQALLSWLEYINE